jgi:hypothetical protein
MYVVCVSLCALFFALSWDCPVLPGGGGGAEAPQHAPHARRRSKPVSRPPRSACI